MHTSKWYLQQLWYLSYWRLFPLHPISSFHLFVHPLSGPWSPQWCWPLCIAGLLLCDVLLTGPISSGYRWCYNLFAKQFFSSRWGFVYYSTIFWRIEVAHYANLFHHSQITFGLLRLNSVPAWKDFLQRPNNLNYFGDCFVRSSFNCFLLEWRKNIPIESSISYKKKAFNPDLSHHLYPFLSVFLSSCKS